MADLKISQLTAITTLTPATDVLPVVDVTGTTKKITSNQILGSGGTATLASATITGDLTVATSVLKVDTANTRVGINTTSINGGPFNVKISPTIDAKFVVQDGFTTGNVRLAAVDNAYSTYKVMDYSALSHAWYNSGSTAMTLNSTGLGVGGSPLSYGANYRTLAINATDAGVLDLMSNSVSQLRIFGNGFENRIGGITNVPLTFHTNNAEKMRIDSAGNVGIGVTPSAWFNNYTALELTQGAAIWGAKNIPFMNVSANVYNDGNDRYKVSSALASKYLQTAGVHSWYTAASGTAGNAITFTQAMTLDASGNLLVGTTVSPSGTKIGSIAKLGKVNVEGTNTVTVSTSVVALARAYDTGGLFFISGYNTSGGTQGWWLVAARGGTVTTIASDNATGLTVAFTTPGAVLSMNTTSGTLSVSCISMTNQSL